MNSFIIRSKVRIQSFTQNYLQSPYNVAIHLIVDHNRDLDVVVEGHRIEHFLLEGCGHGSRFRRCEDDADPITVPSRMNRKSRRPSFFPWCGILSAKNDTPCCRNNSRETRNIRSPRSGTLPMGHDARSGNSLGKNSVGYSAVVVDARIFTDTSSFAHNNPMPSIKAS